ncbi:MAG: hypothetical protein ABS35_06285 [Kaistia sp. SCN 65-12]|nr:MAG: hypothetical protein ABS35_06285 [Kaistia sp. SCN 65-12]
MTERKEAVRAKHHGYIIANREWPLQIQLEMGMSSFGRTPGDAWRRHIRMENKEKIDFPIFVQRWSDKGYGPVAVEIRPLSEGNREAEE